MDWQEIRNKYPHTWVVVEAIKAHSESNKRIVEQLYVVDAFVDLVSAMNVQAKLSRKALQKEFYVLHTDGESIDITERKWLGVRGIS